MQLGQPTGGEAGLASRPGQRQRLGSYPGWVSREDRVCWDARYEGGAAEPAEWAGPPSPFAPFADLFPTAGHALDLACGRGVASVWLAQRGLDVWGVDISSVAVEQARNLAQRSGIGDSCRFTVIDLDSGLPPGPAVDVVVCHRFRDARLDDAIIARLAPGGLLAISALSEVGAAPGRFRVMAGELPAAFARLHVIAADEGAGVAWLLARKV